MHNLSGFSMWNLINRSIIKSRANPYVTFTMSHSATRLSLWSKVYQRNETRGFPSPDLSGFGFFLDG